MFKCQLALARVCSITPLSLFLVFGTASATKAQPSRGALTRGTLAITNVSVIPMTSETVLKDVTVVIRNGRIAFVGPSAAASIPSGARRIDGRGKYLIPGLADMHV